MTLKIDVSHTKLIYVILKFVLIQQNIDVSTFDILSLKKPHKRVLFQSYLHLVSKEFVYMALWRRKRHQWLETVHQATH